MAQYEVLFQLRQDATVVHSVSYQSDSAPCSKKDARLLLGRLFMKGTNSFGDQEWNRRFDTAIDDALRAVNRAENASAQQNRNFHSAVFQFQGKNYYIDVVVEAGEGHFT